MIFIPMPSFTTTCVTFDLFHMENPGKTTLPRWIKTSGTSVPPGLPQHHCWLGNDLMIVFSARSKQLGLGFTAGGVTLVS